MELVPEYDVYLDDPIEYIDDPIEDIDKPIEFIGSPIEYVAVTSEPFDYSDLEAIRIDLHTTVQFLGFFLVVFIFAVLYKLFNMFF